LQGSADLADIARESLAVLEGRAGRAALATVVGRSGSAPQVVGAKLLLHEDGRCLGTVGGGAVEAQVLAACRNALGDGRPRKIDTHLVSDLGMCCGGSMEVFVEVLEAPARLFLIGAGHVAQALTPIAQAAGFKVMVLDDREELLDAEAFGDAQTGNHDVDELDDAIRAPSEHDFILVITRDHARDQRALAHLLCRPHRYLGMIGSRRKVHTVVRRILEREAALGRPPPDLSRVHAPIGLALGGRSPGEIAVSIVAELIAVRRGGNGAPMNAIAEVLDRLPQPAADAAS
jgi:xanthine dehydrogenase accessory factor